MVTFKEIFKGPFYLDSYYCYVWSKDHVMTFTCLTHNEKLLDAIIDKLNYGSLDSYNTSFKGGRIYIDNKPILLMRGWGHLTSVGGLNLPFKEAAKIQDDFCDWVVETLRN